MITFITHLRYDSEDRLKNLQTILNYYSTNLPDSRFILIQDDSEPNANFKKIKWPKNTTMLFIKNDGYYYRTRALNVGIKNAQTPICVSLDADCIVSISAIKRICDKILKNEDIGIAWPYTYVIDIPYTAHNAFIESGYNYSTLVDMIPPNIKRNSTFNDFNVWTDIERPSVGGVVIFNTANIKKIKGYNENFVAWGYEDNELHHRILTLGYSEYRTEDKLDYCFHLRHKNTIRDNSPHYINNHREVTKITSMTKAQIEEYIKTWRDI
jgi:predicted glycosyltransferase involved in capsule biosynthesis